MAGDDSLSKEVQGIKDMVVGAPMKAVRALDAAGGYIHDSLGIGSPKPTGQAVYNERDLPKVFNVGEPIKTQPLPQK